MTKGGGGGEERGGFSSSSSLISVPPPPPPLAPLRPSEGHKSPMTPGGEEDPT